MPFLEEGACLILWPWVGTFSGRAFNRVCVFIQGNTIISSPSPSISVSWPFWLPHVIISFVAKEN